MYCRRGEATQKNKGMNTFGLNPSNCSRARKYKFDKYQIRWKMFVVILYSMQVNVFWEAFYSLSY